jgi:hypothetical protein
MTSNLSLSIILLFVLLTFPLIGSVRASSELWSQTYGGTDSDAAYFLVELSDGGFALAGYTWSFGETNTNYFWLVKTDANGNMLWNQTYGKGRAYSLVETSDGGYAIAGGSRLVKTDTDGNMLWNRTYGEGMFYSLVQTSDGGYALAGDTESFGAGGYDFWLVKTDVHGNMEWNRTYGGTGNEWGCSLVETSDGGYAIAGGSLLVKTDAHGNMLWNQTYPVSAYVLVETSDGGYALAGNYGFAYSNRWKLVKTDEYGNMEWNQTIAGALFEKANCLVETSDGGYAIAGGWLLVKTDRYGNTIWYREYGGIGTDRFNSLVETSDGGFAIAGYTESFGAGGSDFWLIKTDAQGIPEFPSWTLLIVTLTAILVVAVIYRHHLNKCNQGRRKSLHLCLLC